LRRFFYIALIVLLFSTSSLAESHWALVIGNSDYVDNKLLEGSNRDILKMELMLLQSGFDYSIDKRENLTKKEMIAAIEEAFSQSRDGDVNWLHFSGHGTYSKKKKESYIIGVDMSLLSAGELKEVVDRIPGKFIITLDSCNSAGFIEGSIPRSLPAEENLTRSFLNEEALSVDNIGDEDLQRHLIEEEDSYNKLVVEEGLSMNSSLEEDLFGSFFIEAFLNRRARSIGGERFFIITSSSYDELSYEINYKDGWGPGGETTRSIVEGNGYGGEFLADRDFNGSVDFSELATYVRDDVDNSTINFYPEFSDFIVGKKGGRPKNFRYELSTDKEWEILFNAPVIQEAIEEKIIIFDSSDKKLATKFRFSEGGKRVFVSTSSPYKPGSYYRLEIMKGLKSTEDIKPMQKDEIVHFYTLK